MFIAVESDPHPHCQGCTLDEQVGYITVRTIRDGISFQQRGEAPEVLGVFDNIPGQYARYTEALDLARQHRHFPDEYAIVYSVGSCGHHDGHHIGYTLADQIDALVKSQR